MSHEPKSLRDHAAEAERWFFRPELTRLDAVSKQAAAFGAALLRERGLDPRRVPMRRRREILQESVEVQRLWESLAPERWQRDGMEFVGPAAPPSHRRGGEERWDAARAFPFYPEDVVALVSAEETVDAVRMLAEDASRRAAAVGFGAAVRGVGWKSIPQGYTREVGDVSALYLFAEERLGVSNRLQPNGDLFPATLEAYGFVSNTPWPWMFKGRATMSMASSLYAMRLAVAGRWLWSRVASSGARLVSVEPLVGSRDPAPHLVGRPASELPNPFDPLVRAAELGYVLIAEQHRVQVVFPRYNLDWELSRR